MSETSPYAINTDGTVRTLPRWVAWITITLIVTGLVGLAVTVPGIDV